MEQDTLSFITTYCRSVSFDAHHIRKRLQGVQTYRLKRTFKDTKLVFGRRQPMNLKHLLPSSAFPSLPAEHHTEGVTHCKDKRCQLCRQGFLKVTDQVISPIWKLLLLIKHEFSCKSTNILCYMTCTICGKDYVGQTKDFRKRMNNHKSDIRGTPSEVNTFYRQTYPLLPARKISNLRRSLFSRNTVSLHQRTKTKGDSGGILHQKI